MKRGTPDHPKVLMLMEALRLPQYAAVGLLESLWHWTSRFARRGDVGRYSDEMIAKAIGWEREPSELVQKLVECRWLDKDRKHRLVVHDWAHHADDATKKALEKAKETFISGARPRRERFANGSRMVREQVSPSSPPPILASASSLLPLTEEEKKLDPSKTQDLDAAEPSSPAEKALPERSPLLNLLAKLPGDEAEKTAFLADTGPQIEVDSEQYGKPVPSLTVSYYRRYLSGPRRFEHAADEAIKAAKREAWQAEHGAAYEAHLRETGGVA